MGEGDMGMNKIWRLCNMAFERSVLTENRRSAVIIPLYLGKGERNECKNYRGISLLSVIEKNIWWDPNR